MIESALLYTVYLLFFGLVSVTIVNVALIITLVVIIHKQQ